MSRKIPVLPTIIVLAAVAVLIGLGAWQLQRARQKEALLASYVAAEKLPPISFPTGPLTDKQLPLFRYATGVCLRPVSKRAQAGENQAGDTGYVHIVDCVTGAEGPGMSVELGWSQDPSARFNWTGGPVSGIIVPDRKMRMRLVAATAPPGLQPSAKPDVRSASSISPTGHRNYAITWFALAVAALVIYVLAVRKRWTREQPA
jgi:surfeit locus 1 family protein